MKRTAHFDKGLYEAPECTVTSLAFESGFLSGEITTTTETFDTPSDDFDNWF